MNKEGRVKEMLMNTEKQRETENKDNRKKTERSGGGDCVDALGQSIVYQGSSVRKATEAGRSSVLRVCVFSCNWIVCLWLAHLSHIILGHGNRKIKAFNINLSELSIKLNSGATRKVNVVFFFQGHMVLLFSDSSKVLLCCGLDHCSLICNYLEEVLNLPGYPCLFK